jgi:5-methylcytosine-specific restriction protein A
MYLEDSESMSDPEQCEFCKRNVATRGHHVVPRCKGGREIVPTCRSCEDFIHKTWTHNQLRDEFNTVEKILTDPRYQKFLRWLQKQQADVDFRARRNRARSGRKYH